MPPEVVLTTADFDYVRGFAKDTAAIVLDDDKRYLVETRLSPLAERQGFDSLRALIQALRSASNCSDLHTQAIDALTTNETLFFRDRHPFDAMADLILPKLIAARRSQRRLNIWSAASSTGQEAYSIAMLIREKFPELLSWNLSILGTDISDRVLKFARAGVYAQHEVNRGLPAPLLVKYFEQDRLSRWTIRSEIRAMAQFKNMNLIRTWPKLPIFDVVFIRNVLIYFDVDSKRDILNRVAGQLAADGYLILGSAETPTMITNAFVPIPAGRTVIYQLRPEAA